jgi:hypothetical protein
MVVSASRSFPSKALMSCSRIKLRSSFYRRLSILVCLERFW